jgi:predicted  nucleic acid-binding Zn-ribbon protein
MHNKTGPHKLVGEVQLLRIRIATVQPKLGELREQVRQARRRRKEAKRVAQRVRKQFKRCKAEVAELTQALAKAEARLFKAGGRALAKRLHLSKRTPAAKLRGRSLPRRKVPNS